VLLSTGLAWPIITLVRRRYRVSAMLSGREAGAHRAVSIAALAAAFTFLGWAALEVIMTSDLYLLSKMNGWIWLLRLLSPFAFFGGAAVGLWNTWAVTRGHRSRIVKLWSILSAASFAVLLWVALAFHLIGWQAGF
jgi:purine-cytosine permease-like protein